jgi:putative membrane protein
MRNLLLGAVALLSVTAFAAPPTDPEIAHIAVTANQLDVNAGKQALEKSKNTKVRELAQRMVDDHTSVIKQATALVTKLGVTPQDNDTSKSLTQGAGETLEKLSKLDGAAYDKAYVDNEVGYHQAVIDAVDKVLLPNAQNAELKGLLTKVRPALVAHLQHAKHLQAELGKK